jgi:hypothetical protein
VSAGVGSFANYGGSGFQDSPYYQGLNSDDQKLYDRQFFESQFDRAKTAPDDPYSDDNLSKYKKAADLAFDYYKGKVTAQGDDSRKTLTQQQDYEWKREARDNQQARRSYQF